MTTKQRRDRIVTEQKLLKAAEEVFAKEGFKGATTRAIAKKAGLNIANISHYFGDKQGLLLRIIQDEISSFRMKELAYPKQKTVYKELREYSLSHYGELVSKISMLKIILGQFITDSKFQKKFHQTFPIVIGNNQLEKGFSNLSMIMT